MIIISPNKLGDTMIKIAYKWISDNQESLWEESTSHQPILYRDFIERKIQENIHKSLRIVNRDIIFIE